VFEITRIIRFACVKTSVIFTGAQRLKVCVLKIIRMYNFTNLKEIIADYKSLKSNAFCNQSLYR